MDEDYVLYEVKIKILYYNLYEGKSSNGMVLYSLFTLRHK